MSDNLSIKLLGSEEDFGNVHLSDFRKFCENIEKCLHKVEHLINQKTNLTYLISDLKSGSASFVISPIRPKSGLDIGKQVIEKFERISSSLENGGKEFSNLPSEVLLAFRKFAEPLNGRLRGIQVGTTKITTSFIANIDQIVNSDTYQNTGAVKGKLEKLNMHNLNEFSVFHATGKEIKCKFKDELFDDVKKAIKSNVSIHGKLYHRRSEIIPYFVEVTEIEVIQPDSLLPKLSDMKGTLKIPHGLSTIEFLKFIRNE